MKIRSFFLLFSFFLIQVVAPASAAVTEEAALKEKTKEGLRQAAVDMKSIAHDFKKFYRELSQVFSDSEFTDGIIYDGFGAADISHEGPNMVVKIDLPGVSKESIRLTLVDQTHLSLKVDREPTQNADALRLERYQGPFEREIKLPLPAEDERPQAEYKDGVLTIIVKAAKKEEPGQETVILVR